jgi:hypothetical protein
MILNNNLPILFVLISQKKYKLEKNLDKKIQINEEFKKSILLWSELCLKQIHRLFHVVKSKHETLKNRIHSRKLETGVSSIEHESDRAQQY